MMVHMLTIQVMHIYHIDFHPSTSYVPGCAVAGGLWAASLLSLIVATFVAPPNPLKDFLFQVRVDHAMPFGLFVL